MAVTEQRLPVPPDPIDDVTAYPGPEGVCSYLPENEDCVIVSEDDRKTEPPVGDPVNSDGISQLKIDEDCELQAMFYLPKQSLTSPPVSDKLLPGREESLKGILANVAELLSRSPPLPTEDLEADAAASFLPLPPLHPHQPFQVSFTLDVDDDDDDEVMVSDACLRVDVDEHSVGEEKREVYSDCPYLEQQESASRSRTAAVSPTWEEVFGEEEVNSNHSKRVESADEETESKNGSTTNDEPSCWDDMSDEEIQQLTDGMKDGLESQTDNSEDLFGDDEAFLQMTIPDISTPGGSLSKSPNARDVADSTNKTSNPLQTDAPSNSCSITHTAESTCRLTTAVHTGLTIPKTHVSHVVSKPQETQSTTESEHNTHTAVATSSLDSSRDYFTVNFDLGFSLEDSDEDKEEDDVPVPSSSACVLQNKPADSSTLCNTFDRNRLQSRKYRLSTPRMLPEHRRTETPLTSKSDTLPSPIASPQGRWKKRSVGPVSPHTPSVRHSLKPRLLDDAKHQRSVSAAYFPPHPGLLSIQRRFPTLNTIALLLTPAFLS